MPHRVETKLQWWHRNSKSLQLPQKHKDVQVSMSFLQVKFLEKCCLVHKPVPQAQPPNTPHIVSGFVDDLVSQTADWCKTHYRQDHQVTKLRLQKLDVHKQNSAAFMSASSRKMDPACLSL